MGAEILIISLFFIGFGVLVGIVGFIYNIKNPKQDKIKKKKEPIINSISKFFSDIAVMVFDIELKDKKEGSEIQYATKNEVTRLKRKVNELENILFIMQADIQMGKALNTSPKRSESRIPSARFTSEDHTFDSSSIYRDDER